MPWLQRFDLRVVITGQGVPVPDDDVSDFHKGSGAGRRLPHLPPPDAL